MKTEEIVKLFALNNILIESEIRGIEQRFDVNFGHRTEELSALKPSDFSEFPEALQREASSMTRNYEIFYCLENYIRDLVVSRLSEAYDAEWWNKAVPQAVRESAERNRAREIGTGVTPRSDALIDYTNFGELGEIIKDNWDIFGDTFSDKGAISRIFFDLNILRGPIAHCKPLATDEVLRLQLVLRSFFRQME